MNAHHDTHQQVKKKHTPRVSLNMALLKPLFLGGGDVRKLGFVGFFSCFKKHQGTMLM